MRKAIKTGSQDSFSEHIKAAEELIATSRELLAATSDLTEIWKLPSQHAAGAHVVAQGARLAHAPHQFQLVRDLCPRERPDPLREVRRNHGKEHLASDPDLATGRERRTN